MGKTTNHTRRNTTMNELTTAPDDYRESEILVICGFCLRGYLYTDEAPRCPECGINQPFDPDPTWMILS
jgi:hypothetical protein